MHGARRPGRPRSARASARTCRTICSCAPVYKVDGRAHAQRRYAKPAPARRDGRSTTRCSARGPADHGALADRRLREILRRLRDAEPGIPCPAALARQVGRGAAPVRRLHGERLQSAPDEPRQRPCGERRSARAAGDPAELPLDARRTGGSRSMRCGSTRRIVAQPPLARYRPQEYMPGARAHDRRRARARPPAISARRSSIPSAPRRWARRRSASPCSTSACACAASRACA